MLPADDSTPRATQNARYTHAAAAVVVAGDASRGLNMPDRRTIVIPPRERGDDDATAKQREFIRQLVKRNGISGYKVKSLGKWQASAIIDQLQAIDNERAQTIHVEQTPAAKSGCGCGAVALLLIVPLVVVVWLANCSGDALGASSAPPPALPPDANQDAADTIDTPGDQLDG